MDRQVQGHELSSSLKVKNAESRFLLVQNEGSRCLQIIGEAVTNDVKILPGSSAEIVIRQPDHPVQMTFYDGGVQIDHTKRPGDSLPTTTAKIGT